MKKNMINYTLLPIFGILLLGTNMATAKRFKKVESMTAIEQCERMEQKELLIYQQLKKSKICKESKIGKGWTDCKFKAYGTEVLIVGAIGTNVRERMLGYRGSGFYVISVDKLAQVRPLIDEDFGSLLRVEGKDNLKESGCIYNEAYITLDAQVYDPGEFNRVKIGPIKLPKTKEEKTKALQNDLKVLGYYAGKIDGVLGAQTHAAVVRYKNEKGIPNETKIEDVKRAIARDAGLKHLDDLKRLFEESTAPKPLLKK